MQYKIISINKELSKVCGCVITKALLNINYQHFKQYCLLDSLEGDLIDLLKKDKDYLLVVNIESYNTQNFDLNFRFSFEFRKQNDFKLPDKITNIYHPQNRQVYLRFLIQEYMNRENINNNTNLRNTINPLYKYNPFHCNYNLDNISFKNRIIVIPFLNIVL